MVPYSNFQSLIFNFQLNDDAGADSGDFQRRRIQLWVHLQDARILPHFVRDVSPYSRTYEVIVILGFIQ